MKRYTIHWTDAAGRLRSDTLRAKDDDNAFVLLTIRSIDFRSAQSYQVTRAKN